MRANYRMQRLFVAADLAAGASIALEREQAHYLGTVLRMGAGAELLIFNGRHGEWRARISEIGRKGATLLLVEQTRPQPPAPDLVYAFAPIKALLEQMC